MNTTKKNNLAQNNLAQNILNTKETLDLIKSLVMDIRDQCHKTLFYSYGKKILMLARNRDLEGIKTFLKENSLPGKPHHTATKKEDALHKKYKKLHNRFIEKYEFLKEKSFLIEESLLRRSHAFLGWAAACEKILETYQIDFVFEIILKTIGEKNSTSYLNTDEKKKLTKFIKENTDKSHHSTLQAFSDDNQLFTALMMSYRLFSVYLILDPYISAKCYRDWLSKLGNNKSRGDYDLAQTGWTLSKLAPQLASFDSKVAQLNRFIQDKNYQQYLEELSAPLHEIASLFLYKKEEASQNQLFFSDGLTGLMRILPTNPFIYEYSTTEALSNTTTTSAMLVQLTDIETAKFQAFITDILNDLSCFLLKKSFAQHVEAKSAEEKSKKSSDAAFFTGSLKKIPYLLLLYQHRETIKHALYCALEERYFPLARCIRTHADQKYVDDLKKLRAFIPVLWKLCTEEKLFEQYKPLLKAALKHDLPKIKEVFQKHPVTKNQNEIEEINRERDNLFKNMLDIDGLIERFELTQYLGKGGFEPNESNNISQPLIDWLAAYNRVNNSKLLRIFSENVFEIIDENIVAFNPDKLKPILQKAIEITCKAYKRENTFNSEELNNEQLCIFTFLWLYKIFACCLLKDPPKLFGAYVQSIENTNEEEHLKEMFLSTKDPVFSQIQNLASKKKIFNAIWIKYEPVEEKSKLPIEEKKAAVNAFNDYKNALKEMFETFMTAPSLLSNINFNRAYEVITKDGAFIYGGNKLTSEKFNSDPEGILELIASPLSLNDILGGLRILVDNFLKLSDTLNTIHADFYQTKNAYERPAEKDWTQCAMAAQILRAIAFVSCAEINEILVDNSKLSKLNKAAQVVNDVESLVEEMNNEKENRMIDTFLNLLKRIDCPLDRLIITAQSEPLTQKAIQAERKRLSKNISSLKIALDISNKKEISHLNFIVTKKHSSYSEIKLFISDSNETLADNLKKFIKKMEQQRDDLGKKSDDLKKRIKALKKEEKLNVQKECSLTQENLQEDPQITVNQKNNTEKDVLNAKLNELKSNLTKIQKTLNAYLDDKDVGVSDSLNSDVFKQTIPLIETIQNTKEFKENYEIEKSLHEQIDTVFETLYKIIKKIREGIENCDSLTTINERYTDRMDFFSLLIRLYNILDDANWGVDFNLTRVPGEKESLSSEAIRDALKEKITNLLKKEELQKAIQENNVDSSQASNSSLFFNNPKELQETPYTNSLNPG